MAQTNRSKEIQAKKQGNLTVIKLAPVEAVISKKAEAVQVKEQPDPKVLAAKVLSEKNARIKKYDMTPVKGTFRFFEVPGGTLNFTFGKYKRTVKNYSLVDGQVHTIPRCVAQHLIQTGSYPVHEYQTDINGIPVVRIGRKKRRYSFDSLEFFDDLDSRESGIVTATKI